MTSASERILVVVSDPNAWDRIAKQALQPMGYQVQMASDAGRAFKAIDDFQPHLIIASLNLPGLSGKDFLAALRSQQVDIPVIVLADQGMEGAIIQAFRLGAADYLQWPVREAEVLAAVERVLLQGRAHREREELARQLKDTNEELRQRLRELTTIIGIGKALTSAQSPDSFFGKIVEGAIYITRADCGWLLLREETGSPFVLAAQRSLPDQLARLAGQPWDDGISALVASSGQVLSIHGQPLSRFPVHALGAAALLAPVTAENQVAGVLVVMRHQDSPFSRLNQSMLETVAGYASISLINTRQSRKLEQRAQQLESALDLADAGLFLVNPQGRLTILNRSARRMFRIGDGQGLHTPLASLLPSPELVEAITHAGERNQHQLEIPFEDGRVLRASLVSMLEIGTVVSLEDITRFNELDRIKSDFVNTVSHDLRSPLTAILGYVELLDRVGPLNDQQQEFIRRVQFNVESVTALINDLLDLGRIEAGYDTPVEAVSLSMLVQAMVEGLNNRLKAKSQALSVQLQEALPEVRGSAVRLRQMIANLLENALQYTPPGGSIGIRLWAEGGQVILQVSDTGPGIPLAEQPHIFEKFFRGANTAEGSVGTGLGLAIVKSIVDTLHGRIWVDSAPGRGTTFTVVLPACEDGSAREEGF